MSAVKVELTHNGKGAATIPNPTSWRINERLTQRLMGLESGGRGWESLPTPPLMVYTTGRRVGVALTRGRVETAVVESRRRLWNHVVNTITAWEGRGYSAGDGLVSPWFNIELPELPPPQDWGSHYNCGTTFQPDPWRKIKLPGPTPHTVTTISL